MKSRTISKIITALLLGFLMGLAVHHSHVKRGQLGRNAFLADQSMRYDKFFAHPPSLVFEVIAGIVLIGFFLIVYELIVLAFSLILKKMDDDGTPST